LKVEGGWNVVIRVPATRSGEELTLELLATKEVYVHPGHFYDFLTDGYLVVSLIAEPANFKDGLTRLLGFFN
jgi:alanine-synthesizing transaminase